MWAKLLPVLLLASCLVPTPFLLSQTPAPSAAPASASVPTHAPDPDIGTPSYAEGLYIPLISGQPFQAKVEAEVTRELPDGTTVTEKYYNQEARDSAGRAYREVRREVPVDSAVEPALLRVTIYDPVTMLIAQCFPEMKVCRQVSLDPTAAPEVEQLGPSKDGRSFLVRESLGAKTIDGLQCTGTRETRTYKVGAFGNDKPVVVTKEIWYSPQLQFNLSVARNDPRYGTQKLEVTGLKLGDPGKDWFAIPDGYRLAQSRMVGSGPSYAAQLEPIIEGSVSGVTTGQLTTALQPVEAAIAAYAKAHADAAPLDPNNSNYAGRLRMQLSSNLHVIQQNLAPQRVQFEADRRLNEDYQQILSSPCIDKPAPGDPLNMPRDAEALRGEERAWIAYRDAWAEFLKKLYPNADPASLTWLLTNERDMDLRRMETMLKNRGCEVNESIGPQLAMLLTGLSAAQLAKAVKPVDAALAAYVKAHEESVPNDRSQFFLGMAQQQLIQTLRVRQQGIMSTRDQFEEADLHLNQAFRAVISSPCLTKPVPGDPPNAPISEEKLRAEERAWIDLRDAWTAFLATVFPNSDKSAFGTMLTEQRTGELQQIQNIERNRGCAPAE